MKASRFALSLGLLVGVASLCPGCGNSRSRLSTQGDAQMPAFIAGRLTACAEERRTHLGSGQHAISFHLKFNEDGRVDEVAQGDSTLDDQGLEACMVRVLRSLSVDDLPLRTSGNEESESLGPDSKATVGMEHIMACMASPPCLMAMGMLIGASFLVVQIYVSQTSPLRPWSLVKPAIPTLTPVPPAVRQACIEKYVQCTGIGPKLPCDICLHRCNVQQEWPDKLCPNGKK